MKRLSGFAALVLAALAAAPAVADSSPPKNWPQEKCRRFGRDWEEALRRFGRDGLSPAFLDGNAAFVRAGCTAHAKVCPTTARDQKLADALAIRVINEGMSPTFLPYGCP